MHITIILRIDTSLFGTKSLLSVRPYNIQNFNNIRGKSYTKTVFFGSVIMASKITGKTLRLKNNLSPVFGGVYFKDHMIVLTIT